MASSSWLPREATAPSSSLPILRLQVAHEAMGKGFQVTTWEWALAAMLYLVPLGTHDRAPWADASHAAQLARYESIATAVWDACGDDRGCASLLVSLAVGESGLARDADEGPCYRRGGYRKRCDAGAAESVWQVQMRGMFADRTAAAREAKRRARASLSMCRGLRAEDRLSALSGRCIDGDGPWRARWRLWARMRGWTP